MEYAVIMIFGYLFSMLSQIDSLVKSTRVSKASLQIANMLAKLDEKYPGLEQKMKTVAQTIVKNQMKESEVVEKYNNLGVYLQSILDPYQRSIIAAAMKDQMRSIRNLQQEIADNQSRYQELSAQDVLNSKAKSDAINMINMLQNAIYTDPDKANIQTVLEKVQQITGSDLDDEDDTDESNSENLELSKRIPIIDPLRSGKQINTIRRLS